MHMYDMFLLRYINACMTAVVFIPAGTLFEIFLEFSKRARMALYLQDSSDLYVVQLSIAFSKQ